MDKCVRVVLYVCVCIRLGVLAARALCDFYLYVRVFKCWVNVLVCVNVYCMCVLKCV